jgi:thiol-disulfide isomerase/thioredoxin
MENVAYLEIQDINSDGSLKPHVGNGKPVIIMGIGNFCGYCTKAKPAFEQFAKSQNKVVAAVIVSDGEEAEKQAGKFFRTWDPKHRGVPSYFGFSSNGQFKALHDSGRGITDLQKFAATLS